MFSSFSVCLDAFQFSSIGGVTSSGGRFSYRELESFRFDKTFIPLDLTAPKRSFQSLSLIFFHLMEWFLSTFHWGAFFSGREVFNRSGKKTFQDKNKQLVQLMSVFSTSCSSCVRVCLWVSVCGTKRTEARFLSHFLVAL